MQNTSHGNQPIPTLGSAPDLHAWAAIPDGPPEPPRAYIALFNAANASGPVAVSLSFAGLPPGRYCARDLWAHADLPGHSTDGTFGVAALPAHGAGLFLVSAC